MSSTLSKKSWADLRRRPARAVLTALTISLAVASFGILAMPSLMDQAMSSEVANARLYDLSVPVDDVTLSQAQMSALAKLPNIVAVTARSAFGTRAIISGQRVATELWGVPNFAVQPLDRVITAALPGPTKCWSTSRTPTVASTAVRRAPPCSSRPPMVRSAPSVWSG